MAKKTKKTAAKLTTPDSVRMSVRIPASLVADLEKLTTLPTGTALVVAARMGMLHSSKQVRECLSAVSAARIGDAA